MGDSESCDGGSQCKRSYSNSLGSKYFLSAQRKQKARIEAKRTVPIKETLLYELQDEDVIMLVNDNKGCCSASAKEGGCLRKAFSPVKPNGRSALDVVSVAEFVRAARAERGTLEGAQLDSFVQEKFRSVIVGEKTLEDGSVKFRLDWKHKGVPLCRQSFAQIYGISKAALDNCSSALKASATRRVSSISHTEYKDDRVHDFSYADTVQVFKDVLQTEVVGTSVNSFILTTIDLISVCYQTAFTDEKWCAASLCPAAENQQYATVWLERYFDNFGDKIPNRQETHLLIIAKKDVYRQYVAAMSNAQRPTIDHSTFNNLWNTLFPFCINRPWCDIPGTTDTLP